MADIAMAITVLPTKQQYCQNKINNETENKLSRALVLSFRFVTWQTPKISYFIITVFMH